MESLNYLVFILQEYVFHHHFWYLQASKREKNDTDAHIEIGKSVV